MDFMTNNFIKLIFMFVNNFINYYYSFKLISKIIWRITNYKINTLLKFLYFLHLRELSRIKSCINKSDKNSKHFK